MSQKEHQRRYAEIISGYNAAFHATAKKTGVSDTVLLIYYVLLIYDGSVLRKDLVPLTGIPKQTIHSALTKLERQGYVETAGPSPRQQIVSLTAAGQQHARETAGHIVEMEDACYALFDDAAIESALKFEHAFVKKFQQMVDAL